MQYLDRFSDWQKRAAFISAAKLARSVSPDDKAMHQQSFEALLFEVVSARQTFVEQSGRFSRHVRLENILFAFDRLLATLKSGGY